MSVSPHSKLFEELTAAVFSGDADTVETAVTHAYELGLNRECAPALIALLAQTSHTRHEDIVEALQMLKDPRAIADLYDAALSEHKYLEYDEFFGLARKCTWALADIGTPSAYKRLEMLAEHPNHTIAAYAQKRLDHWADELGRKGT